MRIMALDIATRTGFAIGEAGAIPTSGAVVLRVDQQPAEIAAFNLGCFLRDRWVLDKPDLLIIEHYLNPVAHKSATAIILQLQAHGAVQFLARANRIRVESVQPATVRKHFIGAANAGERDKTKALVIQRCHQLGYFDKRCRDADRADACALFDYAAATFARKTPQALVMFGEGAA